MPPTSTQGMGEDTGVSQSGPRARRRRSRRSRPTPTMTTRWMSASASRETDNIQEVEEKSSKKARRKGRQEAELASDDSSTGSSPLRRPFIPRIIKSQDAKGVVYDTLDSAVVTAYLEEQQKYFAKLERHKKLLTLNEDGPSTCLDFEELLPVRRAATMIVFQAAKAVVGLSSFVDGNFLARCSGFAIDRDKNTGHSLLLTSATILCTKAPCVDLWSCPREYASNVEVLVHLLDDTTVKGKLLHFHKHYNIALFEVAVNISTALPISTKFVDYGQEVFFIGRDENLNLNSSHGLVEFSEPGIYDYYHFMYVNCGVTKFSDGGPVIDPNGGVVGMASPTPRVAFIPSSVILSCLRMWKNFKCVPRLHLGLKFSSIDFLSSSHKEKISRKLNIDSGLIVEEVSKGSAAENAGIRIGDIICSFNGECCPTTVELEVVLLRICEEYLDKGSNIGSNVDVTVGLFQIRKEHHCNKKLTLNISDDVEVMARGTYPVSARVKDSIDMSSGQEVHHGTSHSGVRDE